MKTINSMILLLVLTLLLGCTDRKAEAEKAKRDAEAKAQAEAARNEMETLPKVFRPQYHNKRLEPDPKNGTQTVVSEPAKKP